MAGPREREEILDDVHEILQNSRYTASGKVQAITEAMYGTEGEYFDDFEEAEDDK